VSRQILCKITIYTGTLTDSRLNCSRSHKTDQTRAGACQRINDTRFELEENNYSSPVESFKSMEWPLEGEIRPSMMQHVLACHCHPPCHGCQGQAPSSSKSEPKLRNSMKKMIRPVAGMFKARKTSLKKRPRSPSIEEPIPWWSLEVSGDSREETIPELAGHPLDSTRRQENMRSELDSDCVRGEHRQVNAGVNEASVENREEVSQPGSPNTYPSNRVRTSIDSIDHMILDEFMIPQQSTSNILSPCISPLSSIVPFTSPSFFDSGRTEAASSPVWWFAQGHANPARGVSELEANMQLPLRSPNEEPALFEMDAPPSLAESPTHVDVPLVLPECGTFESDCASPSLLEEGQMETMRELKNYRLFPTSEWQNDTLMAFKNVGVVDFTPWSWGDTEFRMVLLAAVRQVLHRLHPRVKRAFPEHERGAEVVVNIWHNEFRAQWERRRIPLTYDNLYYFVLGWSMMLDKLSDTPKHWLDIGSQHFQSMQHLSYVEGPSTIDFKAPTRRSAKTTKPRRRKNNRSQGGRRASNTQSFASVPGPFSSPLVAKTDSRVVGSMSPPVTHW
jgi:hypothetical protein